MDMNSVKQFITSLVDLQGAAVALHTISRNNQHALGIYPRQGQAAYNPNVGGRRAVHVLPITLLLRWGRNGVAAEQMAAMLYNAIERAEVTHGIVSPVSDGPVWLGADERGVFEYTIDVDFYVIDACEDGVGRDFLI
ncbi:MAG: minor capsid protein [Defluviitaleaceae bacterium]|nr:minor capsid protein [Defluviitaleaceae bacterium]